MKLIKPSFEVMEIMGGDFTKFEPLQLIEKAGRTCYKSEEEITSTSAEKFAAARIKQGHESVIEHSAMTVKFIIDRGVSHELVRHRLCAFSQESTRYCNYKGGVTFIIPPWVDIEPCEIDAQECRRNFAVMEHGFAKDRWLFGMAAAEILYRILLTDDWPPQQARSVLPNSLKTEIVVTANLREWRHIFKLRTTNAAHPQMREVMVPLLYKVRGLIPVIFDDIAA